MEQENNERASETDRLVQFSKIKLPETIFEKLTTGPIVDKFFVAGALAAFVGGAGLGVHLWLMLNGRMPVSESYASFRVLHSFIQFYLFFGLFILGFLLQTGAKALKVPYPPPAKMFASLPLLFLGMFAKFIAPETLWSSALLASPFLLVASYFLKLLKRTSGALFWEFGIWIAFTLFAFASFAFFPVLTPASGLLMFWCSIVPVTFATGQQFIFAFLRGKKMQPHTLFAFYSLSVVLFIAGLDMWGMLLAAITLCTYVYQTKLVSAHRRIFSEPLTCAFSIAYLWALSGAILYLFTQNADATLHLWALGWVSTLLLSISSQMMRNFTGKFILSPRGLIGLLLCWQLVPVGRGLHFILSLPAWFASVVAWDVTIVFTLWGLGIAAGAFRIARRQLGWDLTRP